MYLKSTFIIIFSFFSITSIANSFRDSIGVENLAGKKVILYRIDPKDNYYSISRKYGISPKIVMDFNKNIPLQIGTIIRVPTSMDFETPSVSTPINKNITKEKLHTVIKKETLYSISALYGMNMEELKKLNNLKSNALSVGQTLKVFQNNVTAESIKVKENKNTIVKDTPKSEGKTDDNEVNTVEIKTTKDTPKIEQIIKDKPSDSTTETVNKEIHANKYGITEMHEKGTAVWIDDKSLDATKSFALHRTAPVGTVIKISNPMSGRSVFAKVVGRYTENETTKDVIIVITRAAAEAIGVIDKRFYVNIGYGISTNEK